MKRITSFIGVIVILAAGYFFFMAFLVPEVPAPDLTISVEESVMESEEPVALSGEYVLNQEESLLRWEAGKVVGAPYTGTVAVKDGSMQFTDGSFESGSFVVDMTTIAHDDNKQKVVDHLKNEDFFDVEQFPESSIVITHVEHVDGNNYQITGDLTIRETTNELTFHATLDEKENGAMLTAAFEIDRTKWDITYRSDSLFSDLGDRAIQDAIKYQVELVLEKQEV